MFGCFFKIAQLLKAIHKKEIIRRSMQRCIKCPKFSKRVKSSLDFQACKLFGLHQQGETLFSFWPLRVLFVVQVFSTSLDVMGLTELWFVWSLFVCLGFYTVKNPSFARKMLLRFIVAEKQVAPCSRRNNSRVIPCNWEQKWLFSFWLPAELSELVISAEGSSSSAHHPSVFTLQLPIFHLSVYRVCEPGRQQSCVLSCHYLT